MNNTSRIAWAVLGICLSVPTSAHAQSTDVVAGLPCSPPIVHAGRFELLTRTWHSAAESKSLGAIYANTCLENVFVDTSIAGTVVVDDGRVPSSSSPAPFAGPSDRYRIRAVTIGYATRALDGDAGGAGAHVRVRFYSAYAPCTPLVLAGAPVASFDVDGLPASPVEGQLTGHIVSLDLTGGFEFCLVGDGDQSYDGDPVFDDFGVSLELVDETHGTAGFLLAGPVPGGCAVGDGTIFGNPALPGSGLWNLNFLRREGASPGCINFGPSLFAGVYCALETDFAPECGEPGTAFCFGVACPCGNDDPHAGCAHSEAGGARLSGSGTSEVVRDDLVLIASNLPAFTPCVFFMAPEQQGVPFGNGVLCVAPGPPQAGQGGAGFVRFNPPQYASDGGVATLGPGIALMAAPHIQIGETWNFQAWYRNGFAPCGSTFNLSSAYAVTFR